MSVTRDVANWLADEWEWLVTTAIALYGAGMSVATKRRQDRQEARELERDKHLVKVRAGTHTPHGDGPTTVIVEVTNRGWRAVTIQSVKFADRSIEDGTASVEFSYEQADPAVELPLTLAPDSGTAVFRYPVDKITANFTHIVVTDSHEAQHEYARTETFDLMWRAAHGEADAIASLNEQTRAVIQRRALEARGLPPQASDR